MSERRIGWPVLAVLLLFFAGFAYVAWRAHERALGPARGPVPAAPPPDAAPTWVHHAWTEDAGASLAVPPPAASPGGGIARDAVYDPQRAAMLRELGIPGADAGAALPFEPVERAARITSLRGTLPFDERATCAARVLPARSGAFNCLVRVVCDGHVVYPNPTQTAGYVTCALDAEGRPVLVEDEGHTALDGDPRVRFDLARGELVVSDAGDRVASFRLTLRVP